MYKATKPHHVAFADALDQWNLLYLSEINAKAGQWSICDHWFLLTSEAESVSAGNLVHFMSFQRSVSSGIGPSFHAHPTAN